MTSLADCPRQDGLAVGRVLGFEPLPARQAHDPRPDALLLERLRRADRQLQLGPGPDHDQIRPSRVSGCVAQDVTAASHAVAGLLGRARQDRRVFWRDRIRAVGTVDALHGAAPGRGGLVGVAGPDHVQVRDGPQRRHLLDRLVRGSVLADADRVVGPDVDDLQAGEGGQPDGAAHVVAEDQERGGVGDEAAVEGDAVGDPAHAVLANAEPDVPPAGVVDFEEPASGHVRQVGFGQVGRPSEELRHGAGQAVDRLAAGLASSAPPRPGRRS